MDPATSLLQPPDPPDRDTPPILTIHGDADPIVLYDHACTSCWTNGACRISSSRSRAADPER